MRAPRVLSVFSVWAGPDLDTSAEPHIDPGRPAWRCRCPGSVMPWCPETQTPPQKVRRCKVC